MGRLGKIGWTSIVAAACIIAYLLLCKPVIGMADNGDFKRIMGTVGLDHFDPAASYQDRYFGYMHTKFAFSKDASGGYMSTQIIVVFFAVLINKILHPDVFDIRFLSVIYIVLMLTAFACCLRLKLLSTWTSKMAFALLFLIIFLDVGYVSYFNSFFGEPVSLIFLLATIALGLLLAEQETTDAFPYIAFCLAAILLVGSKVQNAPIGLILFLVSVRFMGLSRDASWRRLVATWSAVLLLFSAGIYMSAPRELRMINQYQSVFFGILKDSPTPEQDLRDLGLDQKLAVLAGTNFFTQGTAIPQRGEELKRQFYNRISHAKIAMFYVRHPARYWQKLQVTAQHAMAFRASYLGNYEQAEGLPRGKLSSSFSLWSQFKSQVLPHSLWFIYSFYALYYFVLLQLYVKEQLRTKRLSYEILAVIPLIGAVAFLVPLLGDGEADMDKHLFLFNVSFDLAFLVALVWLIHQAVRMLRRRVI